MNKSKSPSQPSCGACFLSRLPVLTLGTVAQGCSASRLTQFRPPSENRVCFPQLSRTVHTLLVSQPSLSIYSKN